MPQDRYEDRFDLRNDPRLHAEVTEDLRGFQRRVEDEVPPPPGRDPGWLTTDGFWARLSVPAGAPEGTLYTDGNGFYCFVELFAHDTPGSSTLPTHDPQEGGRSGVLSAVEMNGAADLDENEVVWMTWSEHGGGQGFRFLAPVAAASGSGPPDCAAWDYRDECVEGRLLRLRRVLRTVRGCVEAGGWVFDSVLGRCGDPVSPPGCEPGLVTYDFRCLPYPGGSGPTAYRLARMAGRVVRDALTGCWSVASWAFASWLPVCCDCPADPPTCPPCDAEAGIDTACCPGVPCDLCLALEGPGICAAVTATLTYDDADPVDTGGGLLVCGWKTAGTFLLGSCEVSAALVCLPAALGVPARWELRMSGDLEATFTLRNVSCDPLSLSDGFVVPDGLCCGAGGGVVNVMVTPAPCDVPCLPVGGCAFCPDGAPLVYSVDLTWLSAAFGDGSWDSLSVVAALTWQGGCVWRYETADGLSATLYRDALGWLFRLDNPEGYFQAWPGAAGVHNEGAFTCCAGGTFTACGDATGCDFVRVNWDFGDVTLVPAVPCCDDSPPGCCDPAPPATLYARFTGHLAALGTVTMVQDGFGTWNGTSPACEGVTLSFYCELSGEGYSMAGLGAAFAVLNKPPDQCAPAFLWTATATSTGSCAGAFGVVVSETP